MIDSVPLTGFIPSAESIQLLKTLEAIGLKTAFLTGGALRDRYMGMDNKITDYDVMANFGSCISLCTEKPEFPARIAEHLEQKLPDISGMNISTLAENSVGGIAMTLKFRYQGKQISLSINDENLTLESSVGGDAPINTIAMDSAGRVRAHPLFEDHIRNKKYDPFPIVPPERAHARLTHLRTKIPGLHS